MAMTEKLMWKVYAGALGAVTTIVAQKVVTQVWVASTGDTPPDPNDPDTPLTQALVWAVASGLGVGIAQLTMNRFVQRRWVRNFNHASPGKLRNKLDI